MPKKPFRYRLLSSRRLTLVVDSKKKRPKNIILDGHWAVESDNRLVYVVSVDPTKPLPLSVPRRIPLRGIWSLTKKHVLCYTFIDMKGPSLYFKGMVEAVRPDTLTYKMHDVSLPDELKTIILRGRWQADRYNRLTFLVEKHESVYDTLVFSGTWESRKNTIEYAYRSLRLTSQKRKSVHSLRFEGYWQVTDAHSLTYILDAQTDSCFVFKVHAEGPVVDASDGILRYRVGVGVTGNRRSRTILLYGSWILGRAGNLSFNMAYEEGNLCRLDFQTYLHLNETDAFTFGLKNLQGKDTGIMVMFSRAFLQKNAEWFVRAYADRRERSIEGGLSLPF